MIFERTKPMLTNRTRAMIPPLMWAFLYDVSLCDTDDEIEACLDQILGEEFLAGEA